MSLGSYLHSHPVSHRTKACPPSLNPSLLPLSPHVVNTGQGYQSEIVSRSLFTWHKTRHRPDQLQTNTSSPNAHDKIMKKKCNMMLLFECEDLNWTYEDEKAASTHRLFLSQEWSRCSGKEKRKRISWDVDVLLCIHIFFACLPSHSRDVFWSINITSQGQRISQSECLLGDCNNPRISLHAEPCPFIHIVFNPRKIK